MKLKGIISLIANRARGWTVHVECWNDSVITHRAQCWSDALDWASQYPQGCLVTVRHYGKAVAWVL